jgi:PHP family Zn ribbon phosphoesterase
MNTCFIFLHYSSYKRIQKRIKIEEMEEAMDMNIVYKDGKAYFAIECRKCRQELLFLLHEEARRVYGACAKCGKDFGVYLPSIHEVEK